MARPAIDPALERLYGRANGRRCAWCGAPLYGRQKLYCRHTTPPHCDAQDWTLRRAARRRARGGTA